MRLTRHTDYAYRVLIYLASHPRSIVSVRELAKAYSVSHHHLAKVAGELTGKGYTRVVRGRTGGLTLNRDPQTILLGEVVRDFEPTLNLVECFQMETNQCPISQACRLTNILKTAQFEFLSVLDSYTLADVALNDSDVSMSIAREP